jgi:hypothetical protein
MQTFAPPVLYICSASLPAGAAAAAAGPATKPAQNRSGMISSLAWRITDIGLPLAKFADLFAKATKSVRMSAPAYADANSNHPQVHAAVLGEIRPHFFVFTNSTMLSASAGVTGLINIILVPGTILAGPTNQSFSLSSAQVICCALNAGVYLKFATCPDFCPAMPNKLGPMPFFPPLSLVWQVAHFFWKASAPSAALAANAGAAADKTTATNPEMAQIVSLEVEDMRTPWVNVDATQPFGTGESRNA